jgi:hypothetical protein
MANTQIKILSIPVRLIHRGEKTEERRDFGREEKVLRRKESEGDGGEGQGV